MVHHLVVGEPGEVLNMGRSCYFIVRCVLFDGTEDLVKELELMPLFLLQSPTFSLM